MTAVMAPSGGRSATPKLSDFRTSILALSWSQSHLSWAKQCEELAQKGHRIVALDLRGHGMSGAPLQAGQYMDGNKWADDIAAIIDQVALEKPILVGWSYGGYVVLDYVHKYGQDKIAGINFVAAAVVLGKKAFGPLIGPGFLENAPGACQTDLLCQSWHGKAYLNCQNHNKPCPNHSLVMGCLLWAACCSRDARRFRPLNNHAQNCPRSGRRGLFNFTALYITKVVCLAAQSIIIATEDFGAVRGSRCASIGLQF